jgi:hypothetical protein
MRSVAATFSRRVTAQEPAMPDVPTSLDEARARQSAQAALHAAAIAACRHAADACALRMLRDIGDNADASVRLAMDGVEVFGATAGLVARSGPYAMGALALCESVALGCAVAFERDGADDATARACRDCARACRALRSSVAPARVRLAAA